ncbi:MAG: LacI family DNA-binding transcriptional regulator, partial [Holophagae bacterium]|nr:LacI family DNA-binding transcriptional regulator [Holophagae bacterium]
MIQEANKVPTLQDIADQIGCARNTVSLALRGSKRISFKMRHQIELVSAQVGYVPNLAARNLKTQRSGLIGIYVESATDDVRVRLLNSLVNELHTTHYKPILGIANSPTEEKWHTAPWIQSFLALNVEALVVVKGLYEIDQPEADILKQLPTIIVG